MKRQDRELLDVIKSGIKGILEDAEAHLRPLCIPGMEKSLRRDYEHVVLSLKNRGMGFITHDLPNLEGAILTGMDTGVLPSAVGFKTHRTARVPVFMQGLWLRIFDESGYFLDQPDPTAILLVRTLAGFGKKVLVECHEKYKEQCYDNYVTIDNGLRNPSPWWGDLTVPVPISGDASLVHFCDSLDGTLPLFEARCFLDRGPPGSRYLLANLQRFADDFVGNLPEYNPASFIWWERTKGNPGGKHGAGAVASGNAQTDKYADRHWGPLIRSAFEFEDFRLRSAFGNEILPESHLLPSRVIGVHKDAKKIRIIACEPSNNQWLQQLTLSFLKKQVLVRTQGQIQLDRQDLSREAARLGSLDRETGTIDLSDASDRLSLWVVERAFRRNYSLLSALRAHRTPYALIPKRGHIRLKKFASQGSAVTFPIQSLVFWMICQSVATNGDLRKLGKTARSRAVRVYGDDIVVHASDYSAVCELLVSLELKVNNAKSYVNGFFRESCGGDYWKGYDVTPIRLRNVYKSFSPSSLQALLDVSNNAHEAGLWHLARRLYERLPKRVSSNVPYKRVNSMHVKGGNSWSYAASLSTFGCVSNHHLSSRWNTDLQRHESKMWSLKTKSEDLDRDGVSRLQKGIYEVPSCTEGYHSNITGRPMVREHHVWEPVAGNPADGLLR